MRSREPKPPNVIRLAGVVVAAGLCFALVCPAGGCEIVDAGDIVVTWRFNGQPIDENADPCKVFNAAKRPMPSGLARIDIEGPDDFSDYVICSNRETVYPLTFYQDLAARPPMVYARWLKDLSPGDYHVTLSFIDHNGSSVDSIDSVEAHVTIGRGERKRIDFDVPLPFGRVDVSWSVAGGQCSDLGAVSTQVRLVPGSAGDQVERTFDCDLGTSTATPLTPVTPGDYELSARLLDGSGTAVTDWKSAGAVDVHAAETAETLSVTFDASDLIDQ